MEAGIIFQQMIIIFLLILVGYICKKCKLINEDNKKCISSLVINVFNPSLLISSTLSSDKSPSTDTLIEATISAVVMFIVLSILGKLFSVAEKDEREKKVLRLMYIFSNIGFIGIPVIKAVMGNEYLIHVAIFNIEYTIYFYTYARSLVMNDNGKANKKARFDIRPAIFNTGTIAACLSLVFFLLKIKLPYIVSVSLTHLGNATTPLAMMIVGITIAEQKKLISILKDKSIYLFCFIKMLMVPAIVAIILKYLPISEEMKVLTLIMVSMPVGNMPLILLNENNWNAHRCSNGIILTTLLSVLTIPLLMIFFYLIH